MSNEHDYVRGLILPALMASLFLIGRPGLGIGQNVSDKTQLFERYRDAVKRLEKKYQTYESTGIFTRKVGKTEEIDRQFSLRCVRQNKKRILLSDWSKSRFRRSQYLEEVYLSDGETGFRLTRSYPDAPMIRLEEETPPGKSFDDNFKLYGERFSGAAFHILDIPISQLIEEPAFVVKDAVLRHDGLVRFDYDYSSSRNVLKSGWILVDPQKDWSIRQYESKLPAVFKGKVFSGRVEYREEEGTSRFVPALVVNHAPEGEYTIEFSRFTLEPRIAEGAFSPAAFGVAEKDGWPRSLSQPLRLFGMFVACVVFGLAVFLARRLISWRTKAL